jgi:hypothetical protein
VDGSLLDANTGVRRISHRMVWVMSVCLVM